MTMQLVVVNVIFALYGAQALTYVFAANIARREGHQALTKVYAASAGFHALLCLGHLIVQ